MATAHDRLILNAIVNPLLPLGEGVFDEEQLLPEDLKDNDPDTDLVKKSKDLEAAGIKEAECGNVEEALTIFDQAVIVAPDRPASYNNRAQVHRLRGDVNKALDDLNKAIELSGGKGRSACQAFCQRGMIYRKEGRDCEAKSDFEKASNLGSEFAKSVLVQMNPYAAMCNKMLRNVFAALEEGSPAIKNPFQDVDDKKSTHG